MTPWLCPPDGRDCLIAPCAAHIRRESLPPVKNPALVGRAVGTQGELAGIRPLQDHRRGYEGGTCRPAGEEIVFVYDFIRAIYPCRAQHIQGFLYDAVDNIRHYLLLSQKSHMFDCHCGM